MLGLERKERIFLKFCYAAVISSMFPSVLKKKFKKPHQISMYFLALITEDKSWMS